MSLNSEMRRLTENLLEAHGERFAAVAGIRTGAAQELAEFRAAQQEMSAERRARLAELLARLGVQRDGLASETRAFVEAADAAQQQLAAEQRARMAELVARLGAQRDRLASETRTFVEAADAAHQEMTAEQRARLGAQRDGLASETRAFLQAADAAQQEMSAEQRARMAELVARLGAQRDGLASETRAFLQAADAAQQEMSADHGDARRVWSSFAELMQERRSKGQAAPAPVVPPPAPAPPPAPPAIATPSRSGGDRARAPAVPPRKAAEDDLTAIGGIGVGMKQRLNQGGIRSFAQLAHCTPEQLREVLGNAGRLAKVNNWIKEAQDLM